MPKRPTTAAELAKHRRRERLWFDYLTLFELGARLTELRATKRPAPRAVIEATERDYAAQLALLRQAT